MDEKFVVYITTYTGDKLPTYYIGSTYYEKIKKGYHGSVCSKKWKDTYEEELRNNPHKFKTEIIEFCNTRKEALERELYHQKKNMVVESPDFFNESYAEPNGFFGNRNIAALNATNNENTKNRIWVNNGVKSKMVFKGDIPDGYSIGRCNYDKMKISKSTSGIKKSWRWITNLETDISKRICNTEPLPDGYREGRTKNVSSNMIKSRRTKYSWYYNESTHEVKRFYENEIVPDGYIKGRGDAFSKKIKARKNEISNNNER